MENQNLCEAVQDIPPGAARRCWNGRVDYRCGGGSHWHAQGVKLSESPLYFELNWQQTVDDPLWRVGYFRLDLNGLLRDGYIRSANADEHGAACVRLRFFRADDGSYYVQTKQGRPKLFFAADSVIPRETQEPPIDLPEPPPRCEAQISRIIRYTQLARELKSLYGFACQVCGLRIEPAPNSFYIEVHHVRPLGGSHAGLDIQANMLVLCPNHHAMFDYGIPRFLSPQRIEIAGITHDLTIKHELSPESIAYHNNKIKTILVTTENHSA
jgi:hypothetical protein